MAQDDIEQRFPNRENDVELGTIVVRWMLNEQGGDYIDFTTSNGLKKFDTVKMLTVAQHSALTDISGGPS